MLCSVLYSRKPLIVYLAKRWLWKRENDKMFVIVKLPASKAIAGP